MKKYLILLVLALVGIKVSKAQVEEYPPSLKELFCEYKTLVTGDKYEIKKLLERSDSIRRISPSISKDRFYIGLSSLTPTLGSSAAVGLNQLKLNYFYYTGNSVKLGAGIDIAENKLFNKDRTIFLSVNPFCHQDKILTSTNLLLSYKLGLTYYWSNMGFAENRGFGFNYSVGFECPLYRHINIGTHWTSFKMFKTKGWLKYIDISINVHL